MDRFLLYVCLAIFLSWKTFDFSWKFYAIITTFVIAREFLAITWPMYMVLIFLVIYYNPLGLKYSVQNRDFIQESKTLGQTYSSKAKSLFLIKLSALQLYSFAFFGGLLTMTCFVTYKTVPLKWYVYMIICLFVIIGIYYNPQKLGYDKEIRESKLYYQKYENDPNNEFTKQLLYLWNQGVQNEIKYFLYWFLAFVYFPLVSYVGYILYAPDIKPNSSFSPNLIIMINILVAILFFITMFIYNYSYSYLIVLILLSLGNIGYTFLVD